MNLPTFDVEKHISVLVRILKDIYTHDDLRGVLGFKGGTAAMLFYGLDRASVDLDFDLLDESKEKVVMEAMPKVLSKHGKVTEIARKKNTLLFILDYGFTTRKVKIEVSRRKTISRFEVRNYLGIPMLVMNLEDTVSNKLCALILRSHFASRDMYDLNFFLNKDVSLNPAVVLEKAGVSLKDALIRAIGIVQKISKTKVLDGLGDLIDASKKNTVKENLKTDLLFNLRLYKRKYVEK